MTSLAALFDWLAAGKAMSSAAARRGNATDFRLRRLPKEEIHLYVKSIDNTTVVRLVDKKDWLASVGMAGGVLTASLLLIAMLLPGGYTLLASHRMEQLKHDRDRMTNELRVLRSRQAALVSPSQLEQYAGHNFTTPAAAAVIFAPPSKGAVASLGTRH
ncbi:hypothetical protein [Paludibaculum fermentans]|uniref:Septum formation initiator n=1 Tax=Paludibaculum fermentans TaxID=1473598 RepID=A0A7S7NYM5_PALFE|nr:hypothetical protein [Paludibaculum fermentans]QOY91619.1 hypothetical protein IRI77_17240 [Paludibaculum fermentans]